MPSPQYLGSIGSNLDLLIKQGATLGPFLVSMKDSAGAPINLTGSTIKGQIKKKAKDTTPIANLQVQITNAVQGEYKFWLDPSETSSIPAADTIDNPGSVYVWDMYMTDSTGKVTALYYGESRVFRGVTSL